MRTARPIIRPTTRSRLHRVGLLTACCATVFVACNSDGRTLRPAAPDQTASVYTTTTSSTIAAGSVVDPGEVGALDPVLETPALAFVLNLPWEDGGAIDPRYTCDGGDIQPGVSWLGAPADAVEMALVVTDSDADNFVHWVIAGLDPTDPFINENSVPVGAIEGTNDFGSAASPRSAPTTTVVGAASTTSIAGALADDPGIGWRGPCPPNGASHHYLFSLYALGAPLQLPTGTSADELQTAIDAVALSVTHRTGIYPGT